MRATFSVDPPGPLRVIDSLPDARLAVLEGLNGIGKTLAVRLLQVCTGMIPYHSDSPAWRSLCEGLGEFTVTLAGLADGQEIVWRGDSRRWLDLSEGEDLPFERITIDGKTASVEEVRRLVRVHRVAGDETLLETLAKQADAAEYTLRRWSRSAIGSSDSPLARLEALANSALRTLSEWTEDQYEELQQEIDQRETELESLAKSHESAKQRLQLFDDAATLQVRLKDLKDVAPDLRRELQRIDKEIESNRSKTSDVQKRFIRVAERAASTQPVLRELKNARKTLERNRNRLSSSVTEATEIAAELGIDAANEAHDEKEQTLNEEISRLSDLQLDMDSAPAMREVLDEVSEHLQVAENRGLGSQVAVDDPEIDLQLTVNQTRVGVTTRRRQLEGQPPPPEAKRVAEELKQLNEELRLLSALQGKLVDVARFTRLVGENEDRVDRATEGADPDALGELSELENERRELDDHALDLASARARMAQKLSHVGTESASVVEQRLKKALDALGIAEAQLPGAREEQSNLTDEFAVELKDERRTSSELKRELARADADVRRAFETLSSDDELTWLRESLPDLPPKDHDPSTVERIRALDEARHRVQSIAERLGRHRTQIAAVTGALRSVARHLRDEPAESAEYVPQLEAWLGNHFSEWFNTERVRAELLPEADAISVDVGEREVRWSAKGTQRSRPLEAFSSGEQAFAYTRARMAVLDEESTSAPNRLIVLDEFGAFIAHDRLSGLFGYLRSRAENHPGDQVLVILPLGQDYAANARDAGGKRGDELRRQAEEIEDKHYLVRVLAE